MTGEDGRGGIDVALVSRLVAAQFPRWSHLPVVAVPHDGWDNRTYRLGEELAVRLPSAAAYVAAVAKEQRWLPWLAPRLPLPVPEPVAAGRPGAGYPPPWSVNRWLPGESAERGRVTDLGDLARELAGFLVALRAVDASQGPETGPDTFHRGAALTAYDAQARDCLNRLPDPHLAERARRVWAAATASRWESAPVWFHGDVAAGNLLVDGGRLSAVIDFGTCGVGDPACDLVIAWTLLDGAARKVFGEETALDAATWARARGWALWKALLTAVDDPVRACPEWLVLEAVVDEHERL